MKEGRIQELFQKTTNGTLTKKERQELELAMADPKVAQEFSLYFALFQHFQKEEETSRQAAANYLAALQEYDATKNVEEPPNNIVDLKKNKPKSYRILLIRAASILLIISGLTWTFFSGKEQVQVWQEDYLSELKRLKATPTKSSLFESNLGYEESASDQDSFPTSGYNGEDVNISIGDDGNVDHIDFIDKLIDVTSDCLKLLFSPKDGNLDPAIECLLNLKTKKPNRERLYYLGWAYLNREKSGDYTRAIVNFEEALQLGQDNLAEVIPDVEIEYNLLLAMILSKESKYKDQITTAIAKLEQIPKYQKSILKIKEIFESWTWQLNIRNKK